jgi:mannose-6-phosphate isomerase
VSSRPGLETDQRPWGSSTVLDEDGTCKVKRIDVHPGRRLSYRRHARRSENWFVARDRARVILGGVESELAAGDRLENATETDTDDVFVEVQHGDYFGEDDIMRLEDDFGRSDR